eukprot:CCRYP_016609-RB/>CCRYP_016609-RB protein AED:0.49 eAED:1.00 QI:0/0/0/1/0/0/2/0/114
MRGSNARSNRFAMAISFHRRSSAGIYKPGKDPSPTAEPTQSAITPKANVNQNSHASNATVASLSAVARSINSAMEDMCGRMYSVRRFKSDTMPRQTNLRIPGEGSVANPLSVWR